MTVYRRNLTDEERRAAHAARQRMYRARDRGEQFERDTRGDHDSPLSYMFPTADSTPSAAEVASWED